MKGGSSEKKPAGTFLDLLDRVGQDYIRNRPHIPFRLEIPGIGSVVCRKIFQIYPRKKRITYLGQAPDGRRMVVKLYYAGWSARRIWLRSERGYRAFIEKGFPAPAVLYSGYLPGHGVYALMLEYLDGYAGFDRALADIDAPSEKSALLEALVGILARQHSCGIIQNDPHLDNFMVRDTCICSIDGDLVTSRESPIGKSSSLMNLARLMAMHFCIFGEGIERWITLYGESREWKMTGEDVRKVIHEVQRIRKRNLSKTLGKIFMTRGRLIAHRERGFFSVFFRPHADQFYHDVLEAAERIHSDKTDRTGRYRQVAVGRENMLAWTSPGSGPLLLKGSWPACRVWKNALMMKWLGIETLIPLALVIQEKGFLSSDCAVFFRPVMGPVLKDFFRNVQPDEEKERIAVRLAEDCGEMNTMGFFFQRLDPEDIILSDGSLVYLGLDAVAEGPRASARQSKAIRSFLEKCREIPGMESVFAGQLKKLNRI